MRAGKGLAGRVRLLRQTEEAAKKGSHETLAVFEGRKGTSDQGDDVRKTRQAGAKDGFGHKVDPISIVVACLNSVNRTIRL